MPKSVKEQFNDIVFGVVRDVGGGKIDMVQARQQMSDWYKSLSDLEKESVKEYGKITTERLRLISEAVAQQWAILTSQVG